MKNIFKIKNYFLVSIALLIMVLPLISTAAANDDEGIQYDARDNFGWEKNTVLKFGEAVSPAAMAIQIVNTMLLILGIISTVTILRAGIKWFFARDNEEDVKQAKEMLKGAVIGLFLILMAYGISYAVYVLFAAATL